jgi:hypothetical protein
VLAWLLLPFSFQSFASSEVHALTDTATLAPHVAATTVSKDAIAVAVGVEAAGNAAEVNKPNTKTPTEPNSRP